MPGRHLGEGPFEDLVDERLAGGEEPDATLQARLGDDPAGFEGGLVRGLAPDEARPVFRPGVSPPANRASALRRCSARMRSASARASSRTLAMMMSRLMVRLTGA